MCARAVLCECGGAAQRAAVMLSAREALGQPGRRVEDARPLARPAAQISSDEDDSSKTSSLHGSESSKSLSSSPPPSSREATEQSRKDIRRERNRQHARVSRERKRKKMQSLEEENVALKARVAELEAALAAR